MDIGIVGAGIGGLYSAMILLKSGHNVTIYEKENYIGGLARSHKFNGYFYDVGPHIVFSRDQEILTEMLSIHTMWNKFERKNTISLKGKKVNYPFENYLGMLDEDTKNYCLNEFLFNPYKDIKAKNMEEFFLKTFGKGIYSTYLYPYNNKLWKRELTQLDLQMVERIPNPPPKQIIEGSKKIYSEGYTHQANFYYPKEGGIQSFVNSLFNKIKNDCQININTEITSIRKKHNKLEIQTNNASNSKEYDKIITTIPLTSLIERCSNIETISDLRSEINKLEYLGIIYGVIEVESVVDENIFAITVPDSNVIFHRISYLSNILGLNKNSKNKKHVFLFEISFLDKITLKTESKMLGDQILIGMRMCNLTVENKYNSIDFNIAEKAYVVYNLMHRKTVDKIIRTLRKDDVYPVGRFGSHEYLNMDQVMMNCKSNLDELLKFK